MSIQENGSVADWLSSLSASERFSLLKSLKPGHAEALRWDWKFWARPAQLPPGSPHSSSPRKDWRYWLIQAGRGFGKTRTGAETVRKWVYDGRSRIGLVAPTAGDVRHVMVEGESGLLSVFPPWQRPQYNPSNRQIIFHTGAIGTTYSADEPERLRGPQHEAAWTDELAAWRYPDAWDQLCFGLRLGNDPRIVVTTTPKPVKLIRDLIADPNTVITRGRTEDNRANVAPAFLDAIVKKYEGTRLGRQELEGELLEDLPGALWTRAVLESCRVWLKDVPTLRRVVVAVDPAVTAREDSDETGIMAVGLGVDEVCYVLEDASLRASPNGWARQACRMLLKHDADRIVAEVNNGGDMVEGSIRAVHPAVPFRAVRASRGKAIRAEPVAALYEQRRCKHVREANLEALEDQCCSFVPGVSEGHDDRMDALVWAITDLVIQPAEQYVVSGGWTEGYAQISPY